MKHLAEDMTTPSPVTVPAQKQLKFTPGIANGKVKDSAAFINTNKKVNFFFILMMEPMKYRLSVLVSKSVMYFYVWCRWYQWDKYR